MLTPRNAADVERQVLRTATLLGEDAFYAWGSGKNHVEGASITLAAALILAWGNAVVEAGPVQERAESWIFTHTFIDMETKVSLTRQFRQPNRETVYGNVDPYRKLMINFGKGQSRAIRNTILMAMPEWLVKKALEVAKQGARARMEQFVREKGLAAAQAYTMNQLKRVGVPEDAVLAKAGKAGARALDLDDLVALAADFKAIDGGHEAAASLVELPRPGGRAGRPQGQAAGPGRGGGAGPGAPAPRGPGHDQRPARRQTLQLVRHRAPRRRGGGVPGHRGRRGVHLQLPAAAPRRRARRRGASSPTRRARSRCAPSSRRGSGTAGTGSSRARPTAACRRCGSRPCTASASARPRRRSS